MLWAITSYFNPLGSRRRLANYKVFCSSLAAPLLTVEWSPFGRFELGPNDADVLVQIPGGDLMWQKERLLNLGIARLPQSCTHVAWVDCDIVFDRDDWVAEASRRLDDAPLVQLYERVAYLAPTPMDAPPAIREGLAPIEFTREGYVSLLRKSPGTMHALPIAADHPEAIRAMPSHGFAWAARRELLTAHPLFDTWIVGGGDNAYLQAAIDRAHSVVEQHALSPRHSDYYLPLADALASAVGRRVDFVPGTIHHLWHGDFAQRQYRARHRILAAHDYDPDAFLRLAPSGAWLWAGVPPTLPVAIGAYFRAREAGSEVTLS